MNYSLSLIFFLERDQLHADMYESFFSEKGFQVIIKPKVDEFLKELEGLEEFSFVLMISLLEDYNHEIQLIHKIHLRYPRAIIFFIYSDSFELNEIIHSLKWTYIALKFPFSPLNLLKKINEALLLVYSQT